MIKYIILNGPPGSGKTSISIELVRALRQEIGYPDAVVSDSFSAPLKHFFAAALAEKYAQMNKDMPRAELSGRSVRQGLIGLAEDHCKAVYGDDVFGKWLVFRSLKHPHKQPYFVVIEDGGFPDGIGAVPNRFVIRVTRYGKDFKDDSRGYVDPWHHHLDNDGTFAETWVKVGALAKLIVGLDR